MKMFNGVLAATAFILLTAALIATPSPVFAGQKAGTAAGKAEPITVKDLVCGMDVQTKGAKWVYEYKGKKYYFCMKGDMEDFKKEPEKYIKKNGK